MFIKTVLKLSAVTYGKLSFLNIKYVSGFFIEESYSCFLKSQILMLFVSTFDTKLERQTPKIFF